MKKFFAAFFVAVLVFAFSACSVASFVTVSTQPTEENEIATDAPVKTAAIITVLEDERLYYCEQCAGECSYYIGKFNCPALDRSSEDAQTINTAIADECNKYLSFAKAADDSGLAYGFTYAVFEDDKYAIIRTAVATVMLHTGGTYSYDVYYYDLENDCTANFAEVCRHFELDAEIIAAYIRLELAENGAFNENQIASVTADCIDLFPLGENFYVKVQNDKVKYETELNGSDLNARGEEIAAETANGEDLTELATDADGNIVTEPNETTEFVSEEATIEKDEIYGDFE